MISKATTVQEYIDSLPAERREVISKIRAVILKNIPKGFEECISYGMIGYVVPFKTYPKGYHANTKLPLPFANLASNKNYISLHHMGMYGNKEILKWFIEEYSRTGYKMDKGLGCIRFKKMDQIPYELIGKLFRKISVNEYIRNYEQLFGNSKKK